MDLYSRHLQHSPNETKTSSDKNANKDSDNRANLNVNTEEHNYKFAVKTDFNYRTYLNAIRKHYNSDLGNKIYIDALKRAEEEGKRLEKQEKKMSAEKPANAEKLAKPATTYKNQNPYDLAPAEFQNQDAVFGGGNRRNKASPKHDEMTMKDIKEMCKANEIKLSKVVEGKRVAFKKKELITKLKRKKLL
jgi:hypothetical protein